VAAGALFLLAVQRFAAQHVNGVLQTAGFNNKFVRDGNTYSVNWHICVWLRRRAALG
jgi:hypothetical protein